MIMLVLLVAAILKEVDSLQAPAVAPAVVDRSPNDDGDANDSDHDEEDGPSTSKRVRSSLFASYRKIRKRQAISNTQDSSMTMQAVANKYLDAITRSTVMSWDDIHADFNKLHPLFERLLCVPSTSAPVERVFSHGGLFVRPHRASLGNNTLRTLVFLQCNKHLE